MRKPAMSILPVKFILFCLIAVICLGTMPGSAESNPGSSCMVNVADGVSLRLKEEKREANLRSCSFPDGAQVQTVGISRLIRLQKHIGQSRPIRVRTENR